MAEIILQDGAKREFADGCSLGDAVAQLSNSLAKKVAPSTQQGNAIGQDGQLSFVYGFAQAISYLLDGKRLRLLIVHRVWYYFDHKDK